MQKELSIKRGAKAVLFSGGLDSTCIAALEKPDYLIFIKHNAKSQTLDEKNIRAFYEKYKDTVFKGSELIIDDSIDLSAFELDDFKIPLRNLFFINIAALYAEKIILGVVKGDKNKDKDSTFCTKAQYTINYCLQDQPWLNGYAHEVSCEYENTTKTELVSKYLAAGFALQALIDSQSCYHAKKGGCGKCKPCMRKTEALSNNAITL